MKGAIVGVVAAGLTAGVALAQAGNPAPALLGGGAMYEPYTGTAKITKVEKTEASKAQANAAGGPGYEGYEVSFVFTPDAEVKQNWAREAAQKERPFKLTNSWYPGEQYLKKYGIEVGKTFKCTMRVATSGTASPLVFDLEGVNARDYSETVKR